MQKIISRHEEEMSKPSAKFVEFEAQIRPPNGSEATKIDYNNVIQWLIVSGFKLANPLGEDIMRIIIPYEGKNARIELNGIESIKHYCRKPELVKPTIGSKENIMKYAIAPYSTTLSLNMEQPFSEAQHALILQKVGSEKKLYRYMNRVRLTSSKHPFVFDCSIVRQSDDLDKLFTESPRYEIEVEFIQRGHMQEQITRAITFAMRGYQRSYYPISNLEINDVLTEYSKLIDKRVFIGPSSVTLQTENVNDLFNECSDTQVCYCVTEKADGERKMLFVSKNKLYFITMSMQIEFTGCTLDTAEYNNVLIDGEHVIHDKFKKPLNSYYAFDIYFGKLKTGKDIRKYPFLSDKEEVTRYTYLRHVTQKMVEKKRGADLIVSYKQFVSCTQPQWMQIYDKNKYEYHIDGLIFTPKNLGVGMTLAQREVINRKHTWDLSYKWKPPEENTVDFLVTLDDAVHYESGHVDGSSYKILKLHVGFSGFDIKQRDSFINAQYCVFNRYELDAPPSASQIIPFKPDAVSHVCILRDAVETEYHELIENEMIIECRYDMTSTEPEHARWIPVRVRWDKMKTKTPNAFTTAMSNWDMIKRPVSVESLSNPPQTTYYKKSTRDTSNVALSRFHNEIKRELLESVIKKGCILLDYAVGKGGDLSKWKLASFVLGIDIFEDNIKNKRNGACQRYLETFTAKSTRCLFVQGDTSKHIKSGEASDSNYEKAIVRSVFGLDPKNVKLGKGVADHYEKGKHGFDVTSIQFAIHYMFENMTKLTGFLKNVAECTKLHGYFVGTCYDGETVFKELGERDKIEFEGVCTIWKKYSERKWSMNESCVGYKINVLQGSIGNEMAEYLVFFDYFKMVMSEYGFKLVDTKMFKEYWDSKPGTGMRPAEMNLSFLNRSFTFQKIEEKNGTLSNWII